MIVWQGMARNEQDGHSLTSLIVCGAPAAVLAMALLVLSDIGNNEVVEPDVFELVDPGAGCNYHRSCLQVVAT